MLKKKITKEKQYKLHFEIQHKHGKTALGLGSNATWEIDPKRLTFVLSRYKFVSKMLQGTRRVLEVGCGDGFASKIVAREVENLTLTDFDPVYVRDASNQLGNEKNCNFFSWNPINKKLNDKYDAIYAVDVLEHIKRSDEKKFIRNIVKSLDKNGTLIIGIPSIESQKYASKGSKLGHVNCKSGAQLKEFMSQYFHHVFLFGMNDEVVHTGFSPMSQYLFVLCTNIR